MQIRLIYFGESIFGIIVEYACREVGFVVVL